MIFFKGKNFHSVLLQVVCDLERFFLIFVHDYLEEYMMLRNLHGLDFTHNYADKTYCRIRFWKSVELKFGCICLVIRRTLAVHNC